MECSVTTSGYYTVARLKVHDHWWVESYVRDVTAMVERAGGIYLTRSQGATQLEGVLSDVDLTLLIHWPSEQAAREFYDSADYRPYREARLRGTRGSCPSCLRRMSRDRRTSPGSISRMGG